MFDHLRKSKVSEIELKEEVIKDLTVNKRKSSKKLIKRQMSSQFSNYIEIDNRNMSNLRLGKNNNITDSSHFSEQSGKNHKVQNSNRASKMKRMNI